MQKIKPRGTEFLHFDYSVAIENGIFKVALLIDEKPDDLKITYHFARDNPWRVIEKFTNTTNLCAFFEIKGFGYYHITVDMFSDEKTFTFDTPNYDCTANNAMSYLAPNAGFEQWRSKLNSWYRSEYSALKYNAEFRSPLEHFRLTHQNVHILVHNAPMFPENNRTEHEQKIWNNNNNYGTATVIRDALYETPPRLLTHAWDEFNYENIVNIADCISGGNAKFYINDSGVFTASYSSTPFCNTLLGHRITYNQPEDSNRTIWHIGYCRVFGNGAPDWGTVDSYLQKLLNVQVNNHSIRVENYGYNHMQPHTNQPMKIVNALAAQFRDNDIIIIDTITGFPNVKDVLECDISKLLQRPHNYGECFFDRSHLTENGNRALAEYIIKFIIDNKLLEIDRSSISQGKSIHRTTLNLPDEEHAQLNEYLSTLAPLRPSIGAIVMNCNPFTLGHRYLIEESLKKVERLFVFVVEEDKSVFTFTDRIELVRLGTADLPNVTVLPSGKFIISSLTFTDYFGKSELQDRTIDPSMDVELFAQHIAPTLGITVRFAGEEPLDNVTRQYNEVMARILPQHGVEFEVIPRKESDGEVISASRVRKLLLETKSLDAIAKLVPETTLAYLKASPPPL